MALDDIVTEAENKKKFEETVYKPLRDLLTVKITVPLGNPSFKHIHTNMFIFCNLIDYVDLSNYEVIVNEMRNTAYGRHIKYEKNRWYVEAVNINGKKQEMELSLNPFPSTLEEYDEKYGSFVDEYLKRTSNQSNTNVVSTGNSTLKGGQGEVIDNLVKSICSNITDPLQRCKAIHEWLRKNVIYSGYNCCKYSCGGSAENCYNNRNHLNCADTAVLTLAMMLSAGLNAYIVHRTYNGGHFWVIIEINGKRYASDQTGRESAGMIGSEFNTVWSNSKRANTNPLEYSHKEEGFHTC